MAYLGPGMAHNGSLPANSALSVTPWPGGSATFDYVGSSGPQTVTTQTKFGPFPQRTPFKLTATGAALDYFNFAQTATGTTTVPATISGTFAVGSTLTANPPANFTPSGYQWTRTLNGVTTNITSATGGTYVVQSGDQGYVLACVLTGTVVAAGSTVPTVVAPAPTITGVPVLGTITPGSAITWTDGTASGADSVVNVLQVNGVDVTDPKGTYNKQNHLDDLQVVVRATKGAQTVEGFSAKRSVRGGALLFRPFQAISTTSTAAATFQGNFAAAAAFEGWQFVKLHNYTDRDYRSKITWAYADRIDHTGVGLTFKPLKFAGSDVCAPPRAAVVAGANNNGTAGGVIISEKITETPIARVDVPGAPPVIVLRETAMNLGTTDVFVTYELFANNLRDSQDEGFTPGMNTRGGRSIGFDAVLDNTRAITTTESGLGIPSGLFLYHTRNPLHEVVLISGASQSSDPKWTWAFINEYRKYFPGFLLGNVCTGGMNLQFQDGALRGYASVIKPQKAMFWNASVNQGSGNADDQQHAITLGTAQWCVDNGIVPVPLIRWAYPGIAVLTKRDIPPLGGIVIDESSDITNPDSSLQNPKFTLDSTHVLYQGKRIYVPRVARALARTNPQIASVITPDQPVLPTLSSPTANSLGFTITPSPFNGGSAITNYIVQYKVSGDDANRDNPPPNAWVDLARGVSTALTGTITGLIASTSYDVRVIAVNAIGRANPSSFASITTTA